jgi:hypothetical protein
MKPARSEGLFFSLRPYVTAFFILMLEFCRKNHADIIAVSFE